jgi:hypothetical protein
MNKTERKDGMRTLIDSYNYDQLFSKDDTAAVNELTGWDFVGYKKVRNPAWKNDNRCLAHTMEGEHWAVWSWNKAIDNYGSFPNMLEALRLAIQPQMRKFALTAPTKCEACESEEFLSVDHKDRPFIVMVRDFIKANPGLNEVVQNDASGVGWFLPDGDIKDTWVRYHKVNATYQILCRSCNSKKGSRHDTN